MRNKTLAVLAFIPLLWSVVFGILLAENVININSWILRDGTLGSFIALLDIVFTGWALVRLYRLPDR